MNSVPRHIVQTFPDVFELPDNILAQIDVMLANNKDHTHCIFDDSMMDDYVATTYPGEISDAYFQLSHRVAQGDFWRYLYLYNEGGIYLDIDATTIGSITEFYNGLPITTISTEEVSFYFVQWALIHTKGCKLLEHAIAEITWRIQQQFRDCIHYTTGPDGFSWGFINRYFRGQEGWNWGVDPSDIDYGDDVLITMPDGYQFRIHSREFSGIFEHKFEGWETLRTCYDSWRDYQKKNSIFKSQTLEKVLT